jgi:hypothetical protein
MAAVTVWTERHQSLQFTKHYRCCAAPYRPPLADSTVHDRMAYSDRAERELRELLEAGEVPPVVLVASERAVEAEVGEGGHIGHVGPNAGHVFAWRPNSAGAQVDDWRSRHHITAELEVDSHEPDPISEPYRLEGSVLVHSGRIRRIVVAQWLAPVADQLRERYGVPVDVSREPDGPQFKVQPGPPVLWREPLPAPTIALLRKLFDETGEIQPLRDGYVPPRPHAALPWDDWGPIISALLVAVGNTLGLPVVYADASVMAYGEGDRFAEHTDIVDDVPLTHDRTVSISLLLNEPGEDFDGGEFEIDGQVIELHSGDLVGFTARTPHGVRPITRGRRLVLVAFGEYRR